MPATQCFNRTVGCLWTPLGGACLQSLTNCHLTTPQSLGERKAEQLQYLGASFGLTQPLLNFWRRAGYQPVYLRQTASDVTGAAVADACGDASLRAQRRI